MDLQISSEKSIDADKLVTGRTCVIGQSGSGKSYTVAVICEELAKNNIGFCIIDTEGEYFSLKEKYPLLWAGSDTTCDIDIDTVNVKILAEKVLKRGFPLIFDVSEINNPKEKVGEFLRAVYSYGTKLKQPYLIIIEEIDKFAPQRGDVLKEVEELSRRGRKRGLGLLVATQRPALVNKNILSQCGNQVIGKLTISNDLDSVKVFFPDKKQNEKLPFIQPGQFFVQGDISTPKLVQIRKRITAHKATTPKLMGKKMIQTKDLDALEAELKGGAEPEPELENLSLIGIKPLITKEEAYQIIKKQISKFRFFGKEPLVSGIHMVLRPIYSSEIKYLKRKIIGQDYITMHTYIDGLTGDSVSLEKGYSKKVSLKEFLGLSTNDLETFDLISKNKKITSFEIAQKLNRSQDTVRTSLKELSKRGMIQDKRVGRTIEYAAFTKLRLPKLKELEQKQIETGKFSANAKKMEFEIDIKKIDSIVRSLGEKTDMLNEKKIYYPFYKATVLKKNKSSDVWVDAVTGKIIEFIY